MAKKRARKRRRSTGKAAGEQSPGAGAGTSASGKLGRRYSDEERNHILETARREGLTGEQVKARFGVSTLTYYTWRKKSGGGRRGRKPRSAQPDSAGSRDIAGRIRAQIQTRVREMIPQVVEEELRQFFGGRGRRRSR